MERAMLQEISATIATVGGKGEFAVEDSGSVGDLALRVRGVGRVHFPITDGIARKLIAAASPSPFGVRDETRYDERVRSTWEIPAGRIAIDGGFDRALAPKLDAIRRRLGLPRDGALRAVLDKLLVYGPGQFFASHQDSERADDMVATLVVVLPSKSTGGAIVVTHNGRRRVFAAGGGGLGLVAFYTDCRHEVERVKTGHRVALTYHLFHAGAPVARASEGRSSAVDRLMGSVDAYFSTRVVPRYGTGDGELPDRLIYLLDHEYTQRGLSFRRLKGKDRPRVSALLKVAERLDCEAYLALAEVHEVWNCEGDGYDPPYWGSRARQRVVDRNASDDYQLLDLCDSDVELRHWVGPDGAVDPGVPANVRDDEICSTRPSVEMDPFRSEHEGYMGNYGNTVDRWYHRAALALWPRSRAYVVRAKASPIWAVDELDRLIRAGKKEEAGSKAHSLLPFWRHRAAAVQARSFPRKVARIAVALDDPEMGRTLLEPLGPGWLNDTARASAFLAAAEKFGLAWSRDLFAAWHGARRSESSVIAILPVLGRVLSAHGWPGARALGAFLIEREGAAFRARCIESGSLLVTRSGKEAGAELARDAVRLIESAAALDDTEARGQILAILTGAETALPSVLIADMLRKCRAKRTPGDVRRLGLGPLHDHVVRSLSASLARPPRAPDNWSLDCRLDCACALCERLARFFGDPRARELPWPLAKEGRRHVHSVIERFDLPVAHDTIRKGSPFTLMLEKQAILFAREAAERERQAKLLGELERSHDVFANRTGQAGKPAAVSPELR